METKQEEKQEVPKVVLFEIRVSQLSENTTEEAVLKAFEDKSGVKAKEAKLLKDKEGKSRRICFLKYEVKEDMEKVLAIEKMALDEVEVKVQEAESQEARRQMRRQRRRRNNRKRSTEGEKKEGENKDGENRERRTRRNNRRRSNRDDKEDGDGERRQRRNNRRDRRDDRDDRDDRRERRERRDDRDDRRGERRDRRERGERREREFSTHTIHIGNLSFKAQHQDLKEHFDKIGDIVSIKIAYRDGRSRGFGYVKFKNVERADKALELDQSEMMERKVAVKKAYKDNGQDEQREKRRDNRDRRDRRERREKRDDKKE